jgi:hypothetical protein
MKIIEGFTKPEIDPSERVGFWDKIRMSFHSAISVVWKGDGDVHLRLKGEMFFVCFVKAFVAHSQDLEIPMLLPAFGLVS